MSDTYDIFPHQGLFVPVANNIRHHLKVIIYREINHKSAYVNKATLCNSMRYLFPNVYISGF